MSASIKANAFFKTLMSIVNIVFPLLTAPYVARILSMDGYTEYNKAISMIGWFSPFAVFGVYTYGMRTMSQIKSDGRAVSSLFTRLFVFSVFTSLLVTAVYLALVLLIPAFAAYRGMYAVFSVQILFICFATDWANEAFESYGFILVKTFLCRVLYVVAVFAFVRKSDDSLVYVCLSSLSLLVNNVLTFCYAKSKIRFTKSSLCEITGLTKPLFIVFLLVNSGMLYTVFDRFVLTWFGDKLSLTYYNISQTIVMALTNVTSSVLLVSIPRLSFLWATGNHDEYFRILKKTSATFLALHTPCCIGMACLSAEIIWFYSGARYSAASISFLLFSVRYYLSAFDMILAKQVMLATGNEKVLTRIYYAGGIYNIVCKILLILLNRLTPELCIVTTASADILIIAMQTMSIRKLRVQFSVFSQAMFKYLAVSILFVPIVLAVRHFIAFDGIKFIMGRTLISIALCALVYIIALFVTKDAILFSLLRRQRNEI